MGCPFCGAQNSQPVEDGWWCCSCDREYPTRAYKCPHPDCWEYEIVCKKHASLPRNSQAPVPSESSVAPASNFIRTMATSYRNRIVTWIFATLAMSLFAGWISAWATNKDGWEGQVVTTIFGIAGALGLFTCLFFCVLLYSWFSGYKAAIRSSADFAKDRELYLRVHRDVFGPIPWG